MEKLGEEQCCVCGTHTTLRCEACGRVGVNLRFCMREHQKLVWSAHRKVCGKSPFPFPPLSASEVAMAKYWHKRIDTLRKTKTGWWHLGFFNNTPQQFSVRFARRLLPQHQFIHPFPQAVQDFLDTVCKGGTSPYTPLITSTQINAARAFIRRSSLVAHAHLSLDERRTADPSLLDPANLCGTLASVVSLYFQQEGVGAYEPLDKGWFAAVMHAVTIWAAIYALPDAVKEAHKLDSMLSRTPWSNRAVLVVAKAVLTLEQEDPDLARALQRAWNQVMEPETGHSLGVLADEEWDRGL
ncbi:hypothetical protein JCM10207_005711 [Rhodosporidiobolus poonsookiae]